MIAAASVVVLLLSQASCDTGAALERRDPEAARAYFEIAQDELAGGDWEAARYSMREAVRNAPGDARIRAAWTSLCRAPPKDAFREGLQKMRARDCRGAISDFAAARAQQPDPAAALLQGICLYELGQDDEAKVALDEAARTPELEQQARLHLGLIALRQDRAGDAAALLEPLVAGAAPSVSLAAREGLRGLREQGRLVLTADVEAGGDSNPYVVPDTVRFLPDGTFGAFGSALLRPFGSSGPYVRAYGMYRDQLLTSVFDGGSLGGAVGWQLGSHLTFARAELGFDGMDLDGKPYLRAYRGELMVALGGPAGALGGTYQYRREDILWATLAGYSGGSHQAAVWGQLASGGGGSSGFGYRVLRANAADPPLAHFEHGPFAELQLLPGGPVHLRLQTSYLWRPFDLVDPLFGIRRSDELLEGFARASIDLTDEIELQLTALGQVATSNVPAFQYTRVMVSVGLSYTGVPW